jgi:hypothetical protein
LILSENRASERMISSICPFSNSIFILPREVITL